VFYLAVPARHECPVTMEKCAQIKEGMTREEVRAILGVPPGDYTGGKSLMLGSRFWISGPESWDTWKGPDRCLDVSYDQESGLADLIIIRDMVRLPEPTILGRARRMFSDWFGPGSR
jgi:hypothetical protein